MSRDLSDDPECLRELLAYLLYLFEQTVEQRDCALQAIQELPNWKELFYQAQKNELRIQHTAEFLDAAHKIFSVGLGHPLSDEELRQVILRLRKKPD